MKTNTWSKIPKRACLRTCCGVFSCVVCVDKKSECSQCWRGAMEPQNRSFILLHEFPSRTLQGHHFSQLDGCPRLGWYSFHPDVCSESCPRRLNRDLKHIARRFPPAFMLWFSLHDAFGLLLWIFRFWFYPLLRNAAPLCRPQRRGSVVLYSLL